MQLARRTFKSIKARAVVLKLRRPVVARIASMRSRGTLAATVSTGPLNCARGSVMELLFVSTV